MAPPNSSEQEKLDIDRRSNDEDPPLSPRQHTGHEGQQGHPAASTPGRVSPPSDLDGKSHTATRRRIQVACGRCRKRKIKCSGDPGDGQGCTNCRSSGMANCQFLRVNSSEVTAQPCPGWPYSVHSPIQSPGAGNYSPHPLPKLNSLPMFLPTIRTSYSRQSGPEIAAVGQNLTLTTRAPYTPGCNIGYEDICSPSYAVQSPGYNMMTGPATGSISDYCCSPGSPKTWCTPNINKPPPGVLYPDQEPGSPSGVSAYPCGGSSSHHPLPVDIPSHFPAVASLPNGESSDRTLPNPTSRTQLQLNNITSFHSGENASGLPYPPSQISKAESYGDSKSSTPTVTSNEIPIRRMPSTASPLLTNKRTSSGPQDVLFGFIPITESTSPRSDTDPDETATPSTSGRGLMSLESTSIYGYTTREKRERRPQTAGTLMNGQPYTCPTPPEPLSYSLLRSDSAAGYQASSAPHETPISPLSSNPSCY